MKIGTDCSLVIAAVVIAAVVIAQAIVTTPAREISACVAALHAVSEGRYIDSEVASATFELQCRGVR